MKIVLSFLLLFNTIIFASPSIEQMISQMILVGFHGQEKYDKEVKLLKQNIAKNEIGGILLLQRNVDSKVKLTRLLNYLKPKKQDIPYFVAIDQEGGYVSRLKKEKNFSSYQSSRFIAINNTLDEAKTIYKNMANELKQLGINYNLAPVVDVLINPTKFEKQRCFSKYPSIVTAYASSFIEAFDEAKTLTCLKHFPGYASALNDAHEGIVDITSSWHYEELRPYYDLIKMNKVKSIMVSSVYLKQFDDKYPATLSKKIINDILIDKLGYNGVIISDDLFMKALNGFSFKQRIIKSIEAGVNMLLFSDYHHGDKSVEKEVKAIVLQAIKENKLDKQHIIKSYQKILKLKSFLK